jgi:epoxyqueuosine reductase QueG
LALLENLAATFMEGPANHNRSPTHPEKAWAKPFLGVAAGDDPYWDNIGLAAGERHWRPLEAFKIVFPDSGAQDRDLSVVSIVCPQTKQTIADQKAAKDFPSERWVRSRFYHEQTITALCDHLAALLNAQGYRAMVPDRAEGFAVYPHERFQLASTWSHRHAAFAAGHGTFGLCDALITKVGKAHRLGTVICEARLEVTPRAYTETYGYCLFFSKGICGKCVDRCPAGALSAGGHDKTVCSNFLHSTTPIITAQFPDMVGGYGCGLCQVSVPCAVRVP